MFNIGPIELLVILVLALIVFGPEKLPELMRSAGHMVSEFRRYSSELTSTFQETQAEFTSAMVVSEVPAAAKEGVASVGVTGFAREPAETTAYATADIASVAEVITVVATSAPGEYETAAAMVEPVAPFIEPVPETARAPET